MVGTLAGNLAVLSTAGGCGVPCGHYREVIPITKGGFVDPDEVESRLNDDVLLVSVMAANSETGVLDEVDAIAERVRDAGALFHCDATQISVSRAKSLISLPEGDMM